jgi:uncharacterized protein YbjT (DUF2867 family)
VAAALKIAGANVRAVVRNLGESERRIAADEFVALDLRTATNPAMWRPHLEGVDAVVNCAGVLQDGARDSTSAVNFAAPAALFEACAEAGVRRVIQFSATGADHGITSFSRTKQALDERLMASDLEWVTLRPSVVVGGGAYGGSALFRGLAALPVLPRVPDAGRLSIVQLDDVAETVVRLLAPGAPTRVALVLSGPEQLVFEEVVERYRNWLGWKRAASIGPFRLLMTLGYKLGDLAGALGWRPPMRTNARQEIVRGATGDPTEWSKATGIVPTSLGDALRRRPSSVQERWFARLFWLRPLAIVFFAAFWIMTGVVSLTNGYNIGIALMKEGGAGALSGPSVVAGALADLAIGFAMLYRPTTRYALWAAVGITAFYIFAGTTILPRLWNDPLGPMMKVWPILMLNFILLAILEDR